MKVLYDGEVIGEIVTNRSLTVWEALEILGIDPEEKEGGDPKYEVEKFELRYE
jgi:hypothetical protein